MSDSTKRSDQTLGKIHRLEAIEKILRRHPELFAKILEDVIARHGVENFVRQDPKLAVKIIETIIERDSAVFAHVVKLVWSRKPVRELVMEELEIDNDKLVLRHMGGGPTMEEWKKRMPPGAPPPFMPPNYQTWDQAAAEALGERFKPFLIELDRRVAEEDEQSAVQFCLDVLAGLAQLDGAPDDSVIGLTRRSTENPAAQERGFPVTAARLLLSELAETTTRRYGKPRRLDEAELQSLGGFAAHIERAGTPGA
jgi:hypothetical protein